MIYFICFLGSILLCMLSYMLFKATYEYALTSYVWFDNLLNYLAMGGIAISMVGVAGTPIALVINISGQESHPEQKIYVGLGVPGNSYRWNFTEEEFEKRVSYTDKNEIRIKDKNREFISSVYYIIKRD